MTPPHLHFITAEVTTNELKSNIFNRPNHTRRD
jgi:hypothetical protein